MRLLAATFILCSNLFALQKSDVVGMWTATVISDSLTTQEEFYFANDGTMEMRSKGVTFIGDFSVDLLGTWAVKGDSVYGKTTGGWMSGPFGVEAIPADDTIKGSKAELIAGNPKKIRTTDCSADTCTVQDMVYAGATKQFTLPAVNGSSAIRVAARKSAFRRLGPGRAIMQWVREGGAFDVRGRLLEEIPR